MKNHKTKIKLAVWGLFKNGELEFSRHNQGRINLFAQGKDGNVRVEFSVEQKAKSEEFLGWFWGALLPAYVAHNKFNLSQGELDLNPLLLAQMAKNKRITANEVKEAERMFLREFAPVYIKDIKTGKMEREGGRLSSMGSKMAITFATLVYQYMQDNGYPVPDAESFKKARDEANLIIREGLDKLREKTLN